MLFELEKNFSDYLLDRDNKLIDYIHDDGIVDISTRLNIYRNAYQIRLKECIDSDHPVLGIFLGDDLFDQMVSDYIRENPSMYTSLRHFADNLPEFLKAHTPFSEYPIIAEIARFERRLLFSFDAADSSAITLEDLQKVEPERWPRIRIKFHPTASVFKTDWNTVESWQAIKNNETPPETAQQSKSCWLVWRDRDRLTQYRAMTESALQIYTSFENGNSFAEVCESLLQVLPGEEVSQTSVQQLIDWLSAGVIQEITTY